MQKQLTKIGSSLGIIIDKSILDLLRIGADTPLEVTTDGDRLVLQPIRTIGESAARSSYRRVASRHRKSLKKLAK
jgi:antitoxin component of MazEF toxin-antitoxin module